MTLEREQKKYFSGEKGQMNAFLCSQQQGEPRVENMTEPKVRMTERLCSSRNSGWVVILAVRLQMVIFDKPYFTGKSRTITANMRDFISRSDSQQTVFMGSVGSLKVLGGM